MRPLLVCVAHLHREEALMGWLERMDERHQRLTDDEPDGYRTSPGAERIFRASAVFWLMLLLGGVVIAIVRAVT